MVAVNDSSKVRLNMWILHTMCPNYTIYKQDLDPETMELLELKAKGREALATDARTRELKNKQLCVESLEYDKARVENTVFAKADSNGDFYISEPEVVRIIWDMIKNDPSPKPFLDEKSPPIPGLEESDVRRSAKSTNVTQVQKTLNRSV